MQAAMASTTEGNEVLLRIGSTVAAEQLVMDLEMGSGTAMLAAPPISP